MRVGAGGATFRAAAANGIRSAAATDDGRKADGRTPNTAARALICSGVAHCLPAMRLDTVDAAMPDSAAIAVPSQAVGSARSRSTSAGVASGMAWRTSAEMARIGPWHSSQLVCQISAVIATLSASHWVTRQEGG